MKQYKKLILVICVFIVCMVITILAIVLLKTDWQFVSDQNKANNFTPTNDIKDIADNLTLTERGRVVFYASSPTLMAGESFNKECNNYRSDVYIAGCYYEDTSHDEHIVIYDVSSGVLEENGISYDFSSYRRIVALHEFLHAAWARLSDSVKNDACNSLSTIVYQVPRLQEELSTYNDEAFCTESFARIGSEYMPLFMNTNLYHDSNIPTKLQDLTISAQNAVEVLESIYATYFNVYNTGLAIDHWKNIITLTQFENNLADFEKSLWSDSQIIDQMITTYYQSPSRYFYYVVMAAIESHNNEVARYNSYIETYNKIYTILDSTKLRTTGDYVDL